tara:strand:+ start:765 stop:1082 length:318 start_codon:yes stop_codon:yes gene_type:complete
MAYQHKPNRGSLSYNSKMDEAPDPSKAPSYKGDGMIDLAGLGLGAGCVDVWLSIWVGEWPDGNEKLSLSIRPKEPMEDTPATTDTKPPAKNEGRLQHGKKGDIPW